MDKPIPWTKLTADYMQGIQPKELSKKYDVPVAVIHRKLSANGTTQKLRDIKSSLQDEIREKIEKASSKVIDKLFNIVESEKTMKELTAELVKEKYEELTDNNMHGEAMLLIAKYFEDYLDVTQLKGINKIHDELGFLPIELSQYRHAIWNNMCEALPIKELLK